MAEFENDEYTENGDDERKSLEERDRFRGRAHAGTGRGQPFHVALNKAVENAYAQARADGASGPLRLVELHAWGDNPPNWCRVVLVDDGS